MSNKALIYNKALSFLSRREHSRHELRTKLSKRFPEDILDIELALDELEAKKYLANQRFAEMIARHRATQGYGPNYIKQQLKSHQVSIDPTYFYDADIEQAFFEGFMRKFKTRFKTLPKTSLEQAKLRHYFLQRGFLREQIEDYLSRIDLSVK
jgi:regulatory protein